MGAKFKDAPRPTRAMLQQEYAEMLRGMMKAMKDNYDVSKSSTAASGTYVSFVHSVVEFLLQHTTDIVEHP